MTERTPYSVGYESAARKELSKLDKPVARRIVRAISELGTDPRPPGCRRLVGYDDLWRIRIGDYRVIYTIMDTELIVIVLRIAHRSEVYNRI